MGKNIVVCSDGTGNEGGLINESNVFKLYRKIVDDPTQSTFYDRGLGTEPPFGWIRNHRTATEIWNYTGGNIARASGAGISKNIKDCYYYIVDNYEPDDKIFLFGFSRGAYTVRSLGGLISRCGILKKKYRKLSPDAYDLYKSIDENSKKTIRFAREFGERFSHKISENGEKFKTGAIYFIGVWDTVGALGLPYKFLNNINPFPVKFHNTTLDKHVSFGYQALAIDDQRRVFEPILWDEKDIPETQTIEQVWFAGMHSDVGGGYSRTGLSDIACQWMINQAGAKGLKMEKDWQNEVHPDTVMNPMHDSREGLGRLYSKKIRDIQGLSKNKSISDIKIHESVKDRINNISYQPNNLTKPVTWVG